MRAATWIVVALVTSAPLAAGCGSDAAGSTVEVSVTARVESSSTDYGGQLPAGVDAGSVGDERFIRKQMRRACADESVDAVKLRVRWYRVSQGESESTTRTYDCGPYRS